MRRSWYVRDPEDGFSVHATEEEARNRAQDILEEERDCAADDGWREDMTDLEWGELICHGRAVCVKEEQVEGERFDVIQEWALKEGDR